MCGVLVGRKLFGAAYSGLEYDYRGLLRLYNAQGSTHKAAEYSAILHAWTELRDRRTHADTPPPLHFTSAADSSVDHVVARFLSSPDRTDSRHD